MPPIRRPDGLCRAARNGGLVGPATRILVAALLLAAGPAKAAPDWVVLPTASADVSFAVDLASLRRTGSRVSFWERLRYLKPEQTDAVSGKPIKEKRVHRVMDCAKRSQGFVYGAVYAEDGSFIESTSQDRARLKLTPIPPGTLAEQELQLVCGQGQDSGRAR